MLTWNNNGLKNDDDDDDECNDYYYDFLSPYGNDVISAFIACEAY